MLAFRERPDQVKELLVAAKARLQTAEALSSIQRAVGLEDIDSLPLRLRKAPFADPTEREFFRLGLRQRRIESLCPPPDLPGKEVLSRLLDRPSSEPTSNARRQGLLGACSQRRWDASLPFTQVRRLFRRQCPQSETRR